MKIYISGAITGLPPESTKAKFEKAEKSLTEQGYEAISPLKNGIPCSFPRGSHIAMNIVLLLGCEAVYFLPDWNISRGATLENSITKITGRRMIYEQAPVFMELKEAITEVTGVPFYEMAGHSRERRKVYARMIYAHFCVEQGATVADTAAEMRRGYPTVLYYLQKFREDMKYSREFREMVNRVKEYRL